MRWRRLVPLAAGLAGLAGAVAGCQTPSARPTGESETPTFRLTRDNDTLCHLNDWPLPYPVYQFQTGDVDGDGREDALVGVVKATRYHPETGRRLFIFKLVGGKARPLWLGSRLGATLIDFRFTDGRIRALEASATGRYAVSDYRWRDFGPQFERFVVEPTDSLTAIKLFNQ